MTKQADNQAADVDDEQTEQDKKRYVSERGPFEIWENPSIWPTFSPEMIDPDQAAAVFEYSPLAEKYGEETVRQKIGEIVKSYGYGTSTTPLFEQKGPNGMTLVHVWFGPNFPLYRHSHPGLGDCLYYVVAGEVILGRRRLGAGSGFFVPNGMPYTYTAGPAGVEVLEFRAGGGEPDAPGMRLDEHSLDAMQRIIDSATENQPNWRRPKRIGDTAFRQAELDAKKTEPDHSSQ